MTETSIRNRVVWRQPVAVAAALLALAGIAPAADSPAITFEATSYGQYVWRGLVETNGPVLQTSSTALYRGAHINVFHQPGFERGQRTEGKGQRTGF